MKKAPGRPTSKGGHNVSEMRLDKFLKVSRIIKRRTVAKEACNGGRVEVNGRTAKPGKYIGPGDEITVSFGNRTLKVRVSRVASHVPKDEAPELYRVINEEHSDPDR